MLEQLTPIMITALQSDRRLRTQFKQIIGKIYINMCLLFGGGGIKLANIFRNVFRNTQNSFRYIKRNIDQILNTNHLLKYLHQLNVFLL